MTYYVAQYYNPPPADFNRKLDGFRNWSVLSRNWPPAGWPLSDPCLNTHILLIRGLTIPYNQHYVVYIILSDYSDLCRHCQHKIELYNLYDNDCAYMTARDLFALCVLHTMTHFSQRHTPREISIPACLTFLYSIFRRVQQKRARFNHMRVLVTT